MPNNNKKRIFTLPKLCQTLFLGMVLLLSISGLGYGQEVVNPHGKLLSGLDCSNCHRSDAWKPVKAHMDFNHANTSFKLIGKHALLSCQSCHLKLKFDEPQTTQSNCISCHVDIHQGKLGTNCMDCHNQSSFHLINGRAMHQRTGFPLTGAHAVISCESCHTTRRNGAFTALDPSCYSCHAQDFKNAKIIDHVANNFSTDCRKCHSTTGWGASTFDHAAVSGGFALLGAHKQLRCESCHTAPSFASKFPTKNDQDCYTCHTADYKRAHSGTGFPTTCTDCHNLNNWNGADFTAHDTKYFPIYSGTHKNTWTNCQTCHTNPGNYATFSCFNCHEHNKSTTDSRHSEVRGYQYISTACYSCHPTGRRGDD